eukprot:GHRQ01017335.1.p1 GENE.GHRQ01017335.1~~GHRQ01017335.1.p1  ORF type:complete len:126 (+),score=16.34 GHRQ01017335.1:199-576(+)
MPPNALRQQRCSHYHTAMQAYCSAATLAKPTPFSQPPASKPASKRGAHLDVLAGVLLECARLAGVDADVLGHDVLALHAGLAREAAHHHSHLHAAAGLLQVGGGHHVCGSRGWQCTGICLVEATP